MRPRLSTRPGRNEPSRGVPEALKEVPELPAGLLYLLLKLTEVQDLIMLALTKARGVLRPLTPVTPPPGSTLKPIITPPSRPSNYDYDPYYDEFVSRTKASGNTPEDKCETEFDPY